VVEAAFAGALGVRLGGANRYYGNRVEHRAVMGDGPPAVSADVAAAIRLANRVGAGAVLTAAVAVLAISRLHDEYLSRI
jgi:adenosylcobinamide-phosphate synthase